MADDRAVTANPRMMRQLEQIKRIRDERGAAPLTHFMEGLAGEEQSESGNIDDPAAQARDEAFRWGERASLAGMIPLTPASAVRGAAKAAKKAKKAVFSIFEGVDDPAIATRMAQRGEHLKRTPTGQYVGAPRGVDSPQALAAVRGNALDAVKAGQFNWDWYLRQRALAENLAPGDPVRQSLFARGTAAYSPQAMPKVELPAFTRQYNEAVLTGETARPRTASQSRNVAKAFLERDPETGMVQFAPENIRLGKKTGPYAQAKDPTVPRETRFKSTNDIWQGRVYGYGDDFSRGFTPQEHGFLTGEGLVTTARARAAGLPVQNVDDVQAAAWGGIRKEALATEDAERFAKQSKAREKYDRDPAKWRKAHPGKTPPPHPKVVRSEAELEDAARQGLDTALPRQLAHLTSEAVPGPKTGHLAGMSEAAKRQYTSDILTATGRDPTVRATQMFSTSPVETQGIFKPAGSSVVERNPAWAEGVLVSNAGQAAKGGIRTPEIEREALNRAAQLDAYLRGQEAGAWNRFLPEDMSRRVGAMNAVRARGLTPQQLDDLVKGGYDPIDIGGGTHHVTKFGDAGPIPGTQVELQKVLPGAERGTLETGYEFGITPNVGTGEATEALVKSYDESPIRDLPQRLDAQDIAATARAYNKIDRALASAENLPMREDLLKARDLIDQLGGIRAYIDYVKKNGAAGLPAAMLIPLEQDLPETQAGQE